jgi:hypothetical protein
MYLAQSSTCPWSTLQELRKRKSKTGGTELVTQVGRPVRWLHDKLQTRLLLVSGRQSGKGGVQPTWYNPTMSRMLVAKNSRTEYIEGYMQVAVFASLVAWYDAKKNKKAPLNSSA